MSRAAAIFAHFADFMAAGGLRSSDYRITITPLSPEADVKLQAYWRSEWEHVIIDGRLSSRSFNKGTIMGVPFKIESAI